MVRFHGKGQVRSGRGVGGEKVAFGGGCKGVQCIAQHLYGARLLEVAEEPCRTRSRDFSELEPGQWVEAPYYRLRCHRVN